MAKQPSSAGGGHAEIGLHLAKQLLSAGHSVTILNDGEQVQSIRLLPVPDRLLRHSAPMWGILILSLLAHRPLSGSMFVSGEAGEENPLQTVRLARECQHHLGQSH